jgi:hypothetical protein
LRLAAVIAKRSRLTRRQDEQQPAVVVVGREDVCLGGLGTVALGVDDDGLVEHPDAPFERRADVVAAVLELEAEDLLHRASDDVLVTQAGQLARAPAGADQTALLVGDEERRVGRRVVVVEKLEEKAEAAVLAAASALDEARWEG